MTATLPVYDIGSLALYVTAYLALIAAGCATWNRARRAVTKHYRTKTTVQQEGTL